MAIPATKISGAFILQSIYVFDFLQTVSTQLKETLDGMEESKLNDVALASLSGFQAQRDSRQGVYVLHYDGAPVYLGKANDVSERLSQHLEKLKGRRGIDPDRVGYKALLLDKSMGTAANEDLLISMYKGKHASMWNGAGFGPKDPGQNRDTTRPGWFDRHFPIVDDFLIDIDAGSAEQIGLAILLGLMKVQLPYVFRYTVPSDDLLRQISLAGVKHDARSLLQAAVTFLGVGWKGAIISYGMVLYKTTKDYPYGEELTP
ncbi:hypothetical protein ACFDR9_000698 [Janthinobacterium sp. CG_23.3]|uniref:GIY-YIG nuclease family protein n=1 Tax=Janthinobacterium sp. CG_23.3 TaxID=3349634 RepID=UPI0038D3EAB2